MININNIDKEIIKKALAHYRKNGFPYTKLNNHQLLVDLKEVFTSDLKIKKKYAYDGKIFYSVGSSNSGIEFCKHFMPHQYRVKVYGSMGSPCEAFENRRLLKKCIKMSYEYGKKLDDKSLKTYLSRVEWRQFATNFRPVSAKQIYEKYLKNNSITYDFCSGFGGRLTGFIANKYSKNSLYIGTDPSSETFKGLNGIIDFCKAKNHAKIYKECAEDFLPKEYIGKVDFAFSSPPYFCKELYSEEETQSYKRYPEYNDWMDKFLKKVIENCFKLLKQNGIFAINIANVKIKNKEYPCGDDAKRFSKKIFGEMIEYMVLPMNTKFGDEGSPKKMEPIYVFKKVVDK